MKQLQFNSNKSHYMSYVNIIDCHCIKIKLLVLPSFGVAWFGLTRDGENGALIR